MGRRRNLTKAGAHVAILLVTVTSLAIALGPADANVSEQLIPTGTINALSLNAPIVGMAATPSGKGSWRVASDGGIFTSGDAHFYGSLSGRHLTQPIVGMASTPTGHGYWFVARDGGIFAFGDARYFGSTGRRHLNRPIVAMAATRTGHGYWLIASDGGVFTFGDAHFYGSTGGRHLNQPIVGAAATPNGRGYWFVARDGGIFSFGDAHFKGSAGNGHLSQPIVGMATASNGGGYLLLAANGHVYTFGNAHNYGSAPSSCPGSRAVAIATAPNKTGYWIAFANAQAYALTPVSNGPHCAPKALNKLDAAAADLFVRMNDERRARGLAPLTWSPSLASYASGWSKTMGDSDSLHHSTIGDLLGPFDYVGENIAMGSAGVSAGALHVAWMHSQEHRDNILSPGFQQAGVGVYCAADGSIWATAEFARPTSAGSPPAYSGNTPVDPVARSDADSLTC